MGGGEIDPLRLPRLQVKGVHCETEESRVPSSGYQPLSAVTDEIHGLLSRVCVRPPVKHRGQKTPNPHYSSYLRVGDYETLQSFPKRKLHLF